MKILNGDNLDGEWKPFRLEGRDAEGFLSAELRWDGCMNVWFMGMVEEGKEAWTQAGRQSPECDYIHLCNPIEDLEELLAFAKEARRIHAENGIWVGD